MAAGREMLGHGPAEFVRLVLGGVSTQLRVIHALVLRETKSRYGEHKMGFLWAFVEPMVMVGVMVAMYSVIRSDSPGGMPLVPYIATGFLPFMVFRDTMQQMVSSIVQNRSLLAFPQVTTFDVVLARALLEAMVLMVVFVVFMGLIALVGIEIRVERPLGVLGCLLMFALAGTGLGFILASLTPILPATRQFASAVFGRPMFFTSGIFFTADVIPEPARKWLLYNPLLHVSELTRSAFFHEFESVHGSWDYALGWVVGLVAVGLVVHQALRKRAVVGI